MTTFSLCVTLVSGIVAAAWLMDRQLARHDRASEAARAAYENLALRTAPAADAPVISESDAEPEEKKEYRPLSHTPDINWILKKSGNGGVPSEDPAMAPAEPAKEEDKGESMN